MATPLVCYLSADSWAQAEADVRHKLYIMRACLQKTIGVKVELPSELEHVREKLPEMVTRLMRLFELRRTICYLRCAICHCRVAARHRSATAKRTVVIVARVRRSAGT